MRRRQPLLRDLLWDSHPEDELKYYSCLGMLPSPGLTPRAGRHSLPTISETPNFSLSHSHTHSHIHKLTHTHTHTHTYSHSHSHTYVRSSKPLTTLLSPLDTPCTCPLACWPLHTLPCLTLTLTHIPMCVYTGTAAQTRSHSRV